MNIQQIIDVVGAVTAGRSFYIAGGFARDLAYCVKPKDMDLLFTADARDSNADVFADMCDYSDALSKLGYKVAIYQAYDQSDKPGDFNDRLFGCMKVEGFDVDVDLLFSKYESIGEILEHFDFNINQFYILPYSKPIYARGVKPDTLVQLKDVSEQRKEYMTAKFEVLNNQPVPEGCLVRPAHIPERAEPYRLIITDWNQPYVWCYVTGEQTYEVFGGLTWEEVDIARACGQLKVHDARPNINRALDYDNGEHHL
ncbi:hypothetical protein fHeYen301_25 [Yersinia phage fHe-Yen3-01]|uniref:Nucleotidyltransferase n=1 Tax=Yersinia phage fHe-Yen3-01 TaxID=1932893 RepID=A0A1L7DQG7_9CAUD|nr:nucleotidyltransferase [Yersinia phage fHe-Yen3-01]APU00358.1 hypothetical protein fHeYen301_25 [Yersinia phage fHe-Yen3-01]